MEYQTFHQRFAPNKESKRYLCSKGNVAKGISSQEFGIFVLSLKSYEDVDKVANLLLDFRAERAKCANDKEKVDFTNDYIETYLADFNNPIKNCREYTDNMIRYFRMTKYIYIRGKYDHTYIDLEPRRMTEINAIPRTIPGQQSHLPCMIGINLWGYMEPINYRLNRWKNSRL